MRNPLLEVTPVIPASLVASARAGRQSLLQLAPPHPGAVRGPRPGAVETDRRQPAPDAALRQPGHPRPGCAKIRSTSRATTRSSTTLDAYLSRRRPRTDAAADRVLLCRVRLSRKLPDLLRRPRRPGRRLLQGRERRAARTSSPSACSIRAGLFHAVRRQRRRPTRRIPRARSARSAGRAGCATPTGEWLQVAVRIAGREWSRASGRRRSDASPVYLLDTNCPGERAGRSRHHPPALRRRRIDAHSPGDDPGYRRHARPARAGPRSRRCGT